MQENKLFEALLDVIPFAAYAVDIETFEVVYANKMMTENMYAPREEFCWKKIFGQEEVCSWCTVATLKQRDRTYKNKKLISSFFDESTDSWLQSYDELVRWPDGRTVKYSIAVDITEQKEIQSSMIQTHTKLAIQSKKLKEANDKLAFMAKKDYLTKVNNRGNFFALAKKLFDDNSVQNIYVAMFDLDNFKNLNDSYGHKVGDAALIQFTKTVEEFLQEDDIFARLGGEEFALIVSNTEENDIIEKLNSIKKRTSNIELYANEQSVHFTVSIGLSKKEDNEALDITLDRADKQLYNAKNSGKNTLKFRL